MADPIRINGNAYEWASIEIKINGDVFHGFTTCNYGHKRERSKVYGTGRHRAPRGRTSGKYSAEATIGGSLDTCQALRDTLAALAPDGVSYGDVVFQLIVQFIEQGQNPVTVECVDCVIAAEESSNEEGSTEGSAESMPLDVMYLKKNGKTLFDNSDGVR